jgi:hypothetical protein
MMNSEERSNIIEIWKTVVEVQQHFNDIGMKIRGLFITIVVAIAAAQGFLLEKRLFFSIGPVQTLFVTVMPFIGAVATYLFYFMDRFWYHRLLQGAVSQARFIEEKYKEELPELSLGAEISKNSPVELKGFRRWVANLVVSNTDTTYTMDWKLRSEGKIELFYKSVVWLFVLWFLFTILFIGIRVNDQSLIERLTHWARTITCPS